MEVDQIPCKFPKISNGGYASTIVSQRVNKMSDEQGEKQRRSKSGGAADPGGGIGGLYGWPSSRIVRVSRATGGKDRHSKVLTSRGPRDRRVRLSVNTAIEFYDLQDRLGYDQPSKAVEWLLAAAAGSIAELPPMNPPFKLPDSAASAMAAAAGKSSIGSSSSETSKGSIARSEKAVKEKEKEKEKEKSSYVASFTELLSGGGSNCFNQGGGKDASDENSNFFPMDYFSSGFSAAAELQSHFSFAPDQSNIRGTLQSNSSPPPPQFPPKLFGGVNHRHFYPGFESRLQLYYGDGDQGNDDRNDGPKSKDKP